MSPMRSAVAAEIQGSADITVTGCGVHTGAEWFNGAIPTNAMKVVLLDQGTTQWPNSYYITASLLLRIVGPRW